MWSKAPFAMAGTTTAAPATTRTTAAGLIAAGLAAMAGAVYQAARRDVYALAARCQGVGASCTI